MCFEMKNMKKEYKKKDVEASREQSECECDRAARTRDSQEEEVSQ